LSVTQKQVLAANRWNRGAVAGNDAMEARGVFLVSNISLPPVSVTLSKIHVRVKSLRRVTVHDAMMILREHHRSDALAPGETVEMNVLFLVLPPFLAQGNTLRADVAFVDQFGNRHWVRSAEFMSEAW
jgi:hypothetical protein